MGCWISHTINIQVYTSLPCFLSLKNRSLSVMFFCCQRSLHSIYQNDYDRSVVGFFLYTALVLGTVSLWALTMKLWHFLFPRNNWKHIYLIRYEQLHCAFAAIVWKAITYTCFSSIQKDTWNIHLAIIHSALDLQVRILMCQSCMSAHSRYTLCKSCSWYDASWAVKIGCNQWRSQYGANGAAAPPELPKVTPPICPDPLSFFSSTSM